MSMPFYISINIIRCFLIASFIVFFSHKAYGEAADDLMSLELEDILQQHAEVYRDSKTASGVSESIKDAPAALVVVTQQDIQRRGYLSLDEVIQDLPGFDTIVTNGTMQIVSYQRGYRTPWTQRTLLLINGKVDNHLWNHSAQISRQYPISNIQRIEVLYGPAGAVYGPNAFLGVINIITKSPSDLKKGESFFTAQVQAGSFETRSLDVSVGGGVGNIKYSLSARVFSSEEAGIADYASFPFTQESLLADEANWGPAISGSDFNNDNNRDTYNGHFLGEYHDPTDDYGLVAEIGTDQWKLGWINWETNEAYGPYYPFDKGQPGVNWEHASSQYYFDHNKRVHKDFSVQSEIVYRENRVGGAWAESFSGTVSISEWNSFNKAWRFRQQYHFQQSDNLQISGGIKLERKTLTKAYIVCGYYAGSVCPRHGGYTGEGDPQPVTDDPDTAEDERATIPLPVSVDQDHVPDFNLVKTLDKGVFIQSIYDANQWRFNGGIRWDNNDIYGSVVNPRGAAIYYWNPKTTIKLIYGEAFQEPAPKDLYGGWSGREANSDLRPEKSRNIELILLHQTHRFIHDFSLFHANYSNVIAGGENVGGRHIIGLEYRGQYTLNNPFYRDESITGRFYYTYTDAESDHQFFQESGTWEHYDAEQGDIAPHKITWILNWPLNRHWNVNFQSNWVSKRKLFSENPLRADSNSAREEDREAKAYTTTDVNVIYSQGGFSAGIKINNLFEEDYLLPGVESANSGDSETGPSEGFQNSLIPQVKTRSIMGYFRIEF